ncbi:uncharacterized protein LOC34623287 [Cyclospora cayetanensis]|uniref:Uncharacterized protein LOC34623287 n=1 Tax=Cyclospora cayetanensis TaxID=88456 RepID=A0A6P6RZW2_9EIME|nr:uncharacterized protein LOC34623287 [Cyclospora cayetanensis]
MLGAVQSAMPSFMCACLVLMFHRQRVRLCGLSRETADAYVGAYRFLSALGCLVYLVFLMATIFVFQVGETQDPAYFFMTSTWLLVALLWFVMQACLKPSPKQIDDMVRLYEHSHPGGTLSPAPPSADQGPHVGALVATVGAPLQNPYGGSSTEMTRVTSPQQAFVAQREGPPLHTVPPTKGAATAAVAASAVEE